MSPHATKILWVLISALISLVVALLAGILVSFTGVPPATAILYGGGSFAGCMILCMTVLTALGLL
ncbi:hypothetical protein [Streptomyces sp. NBC_01518]|uniref:hypothetical protein n=1 Tax=Streptomyces sp. NBC_01518 TaxID=2903891 RepID=UPI00386C4BBF